MVGCEIFGKNGKFDIYEKKVLVKKIICFRETKKFVYPEIINGVCVCVWREGS